MVECYEGDESSGCGGCSGRFFLSSLPLSYELVVNSSFGGFGTVGMDLAVLMDVE